MTREFEVRWTPEDGSPRAVVFEPSETGWNRSEFEWTGGEWCERGWERVTEVGCFGGSAGDIPSAGQRPRSTGGDANDGA